MSGHDSFVLWDGGTLFSFNSVWELDIAFLGQDREFLLTFTPRDRKNFTCRYETLSCE